MCTSRGQRFSPSSAGLVFLRLFLLLLLTGLGGIEQFVLLLPLHAAVLEPDLDLALREAQRVRDLDAPPPREVAVEVELLLQLQGLVARVGLPAPSARAAKRTCGR